MCKVLMMIRTGGYILSSNMLVILSLDRFIIKIFVSKTETSHLNYVAFIRLGYIFAVYLKG